MLLTAFWVATDPALSPPIERPILAVDALSLWYGRAQALRSISMSIPEKKITAYDVKMPSLANLTQAQIDNGEVSEAEIFIKPARQMKFFSFRLRVQ